MIPVKHDPTNSPDKKQSSPTELPEGQAEKVPELREISPEELKHILAEHQKWVDSKEKDGKRADLTRANLQGANLDGTILQKASLGQANFQEASLVDANLQEAFLADANFRKARLWYANLNKASLAHANLQEARLENANLQEAYLGHVNLRSAKLCEANFQKATLANATFEHADFNRTTLREANFQDANLTGATGLLASQFAGANVSSAELPEKIAKFEGLIQVEELSKSAKKLFISMLLGCLYAWLTIATTTDVALLTNSSSSPLPIIQAKIPIAGFYWAAPLILFSLYVWFHFYLQRFWEGLAELPAVFPDGKTLDKKAYPWLLNCLVRPHFTLLRKPRPPLSRLMVGISMILAWWVVPLTFVFFWLRYLPKHHWAGTIEHILLILVACVFAGWSQALAKKTLRGQERPSLDFARNWTTKELWPSLGQRSWKLAILGLGVMLFTAVVSDGAINGVSPLKARETRKRAEQEQKAKSEKNADRRDAEPLAAKDTKGKPEQEQPVEEDKKSEPDHDGLLSQVRTWYQARIPDFLSLIQIRAFADFKEQEVSTRPANWFLMRELDADELVDIVTGAQLQGEGLRGVSARHAFLMKADLREANLREANLAYANLKNANLYGANLQEAMLASANLQEANLVGANLQEADLVGANLQEATLIVANLQEAMLAGANLQEAMLAGTNLQEADLVGANLQEADLSRANLANTINLTQAQLNQACVDEDTKLPGGLTKPPPCYKESLRPTKK